MFIIYFGAIAGAFFMAFYALATGQIALLLTLPLTASASALTLATGFTLAGMERGQAQDEGEAVDMDLLADTLTERLRGCLVQEQLRNDDAVVHAAEPALRRHA